MFLKSQLSWNISIPPEELHLDELMLKKSIYVPLLAEFVKRRPQKRGEVLRGVVHKIYKHGILLRWGPLENVFISNKTMPSYCYVPGENPIFMSDTSKIEKDVEVHFVLIGQRSEEDTKEFRAVGGLEGDFLGPM
ncbi:hypothetical protein ACH5RR_031420 [Cinchona calisaya]|uniref:DNA-directed RNA polymerase subunit n=1 Tax=Cinchona calisaya TaxID=153742 RepID=A0ABD2YF76_9GENT